MKKIDKFVRVITRPFWSLWGFWFGIKIAFWANTRSMNGFIEKAISLKSDDLDILIYAVEKCINKSESDFIESTYGLNNWIWVIDVLKFNYKNMVRETAI